MTHTIRVIHFQRRANRGTYSVERLFDAVRAALPADIQVAVQVNQHPSTGIAGRIADSLSARRRRGAINHVLGDVHYLAWGLPRRGTVLTVLDCIALERSTGARRYALWLLWYWWPLQRTDHVTVISDYTRDALLEWVRFPPERIHVISPPLAPDFIALPALPRGDRFRLLQVGTSSNKNLHRVIEAIQGLPVTLTIIGPLAQRDREVLTRFQVSFENHVGLGDSELLEQYRLCDALIFASTYEGWGMPIIEAHAVGRPVITSNVCSMPQAAGGAACLVDPLNVSEIRGSIVRFIEEPEYCAELVARGRSNALLYTPERIAAQYAELYRAIDAQAG